MISLIAVFNERRPDCDLGDQRSQPRSEALYKVFKGIEMGVLVSLLHDFER